MACISKLVLVLPVPDRPPMNTTSLAMGAVLSMAVRRSRHFHSGPVHLRFRAGPGAGRETSLGDRGDEFLLVDLADGGDGQGRHGDQYIGPGVGGCATLVEELVELNQVDRCALEN